LAAAMDPEAGFRLARKEPSHVIRAHRKFRLRANSCGQIRANSLYYEQERRTMRQKVSQTGNPD
jgi:hypothetical protein